MLLLQVEGEFLLALALEVQALDVGGLSIVNVLHLPHRQTLAKADEDVPVVCVQKGALSVRDGLLITQDTIVVLLPHVHVRSSYPVV